METKTCIHAAGGNLTSRLALCLPKGSFSVKEVEGKAALEVELVSLEYQVLVPAESDGYPVTVRLVGKAEAHKKSDFICVDKS